jgi:hypothetical protein
MTTTKLGGQSLMECPQYKPLLFFLGNGDYIYYWHTNEYDRIERPVFVHKNSMELLRINPGVLIMDSAYKTNCYGIKLFNIVGVTTVNTTFNAPF